MIRLMIADDHTMVREGIRQLLELDGLIQVIEQAADGRDCISKYLQSKPDILLLDINMPVLNGLETLKEIKAKDGNAKILMLSVHNESEYLLEALDSGADGYVLKDAGSRELIEAIESVVNGVTYIQPELLPTLNSALISRNTDKDKIESLTKRELQIVCLIAQGKINREIAEELDISERTVKNHISNIFAKLEIYDRTQAAIFAVKNNLVKPY